MLETGHVKPICATKKSLHIHVGKTRSYEEYNRGCFNYIIYTTPTSWVDALRPRSTAGVISGRSVILSILFLGKSPLGNKPVFSAHPFAF